MFVDAQRVFAEKIGCRAFMRITEVEPILLRGDQSYGATEGADEATDNGDWQLIVRVATDEGLIGWADVETLAPAAVAIIAGQGMKNHPEAAMELATGYEVAPEEYGYARYALAKDDVDLNHAVSRALDEMRGDGSLRKIIAEFGLTDRNLWYYPVK